jgi:hypothetical protein
MAKIRYQQQYNQEMGKFKLLSSTSGVGAITTTKFNNYVLIIGNSNWGFIKIAEGIIKQAFEDSTESLISKQLSRNGLIEILDKRFVKFLVQEKKLKELYTLIDLPNIELSDSSNYISWDAREGMIDHPSPIKRRISSSNPEIKHDVEEYLIKAKHFPGWFKNEKGHLKHIKEWKRKWIDKGFPRNEFAPPRDFSNHYPPRIVRRGGRERIEQTHKILTQTNLILICENGHLSDVPWSKFIEWKLFHQEGDKECNGLFDYPNCCDNPNLKWSENTSHSVGFESVFIECKNCGKGQGDNYQDKVNLSGIQSLSPKCPGHKPWENDEYIDPFDDRFMLKENCTSTKGMQFVLATANNVYYANVESSLYIPNELLENYPKEILKALEILEKRFNNWKKRNEDGTKLTFFESKESDEEFFIEDCGLNEEGLKKSIGVLKNAFCNTNDDDEVKDKNLFYKFQEFKVLKENDFLPPEIEGLQFQSIDINNNDLGNYFKSIKKIPELKVTQVQTQFTRVKPAERVINSDGEIIYNSKSQKTYENEEIRVLPANQTVGEGVFIEFDEDKIKKCISNMGEEFKERFHSLFNTEIKDDEQGVEIRRKIKESQYKFFIIHTFSHALIKEFEFSCGYPTASLKERLYMSDNPDFKMAGVLIYTTDGAEGSMGGIISQTEPKTLEKIIKTAMFRAIDCSSDPLCWESEGQGVFNANLASCFSCSLVSETTCEEMNLGLDRRVLVDTQFGYFKDILID